VLFDSCEDYDAFVALMETARRKFRMRIIAYQLLGTHLHFLLWPWNTGDVGRFMHWLTSTHAKRFHRRRGTVGTGAVYQSRYFSRGIDEGRKVMTALRYVEQNALVAGLVARAEDWPWGSAWAGDGPSRFVVDESPLPRPANWLEVLNDV
jgi:putative transposase